MDQSKHFSQLLYFVHLVDLTQQNFDELVSSIGFGKRIDKLFLVVIFELFCTFEAHLDSELCYKYSLFLSASGWEQGFNKIHKTFITWIANKSDKL